MVNLPRHVFVHKYSKIYHGTCEVALRLKGVHCTKLLPINVINCRRNFSSFSRISFISKIYFNLSRLIFLHCWTSDYICTKILLSIFCYTERSTMTSWKIGNFTRVWCRNYFISRLSFVRTRQSRKDRIGIADERHFSVLKGSCRILLS